MARLYVNFKTNLRKKSEDECGTCIDYLVFCTDEGKIAVSCSYGSDSELGDDGTFQSGWEGLDCSSEEFLGDEIKDMTPEIFSALKKSGRIDSIGIYADENTIIPDRPVVEDVEATILFAEEELTLKTESITIDRIGE